MKPSSPYEIILYYKYTPVADPKGFMNWHKEVCAKLGLKCRILIAKEGINGTLEGLKKNVEEYCKLLHAQKGGTGDAADMATFGISNFGDFSDVAFKRSEGTPDGTAFPKIKVKVRDEVVSLKLAPTYEQTNEMKAARKAAKKVAAKAGSIKGEGLSADVPSIVSRPASVPSVYDADEDVNPNVTTGIHLKPEELNSWYEKGEDFVVIDMRNDYEYKVGHFKDSINPELTNFRDLPAAMPKLDPIKEAAKKGKKVLTVCTGGIRCEKASGYLIKKGFENVYQLDGGMHSYMEKFPGKDFHGALYVFDGREKVDFATEKGIPRAVVGKCDVCDATTETFTNCANDECHIKMLCCDQCQKDAQEKVRQATGSDAQISICGSFIFCSDTCREHGRIGRAKVSELVG